MNGGIEGDDGTENASIVVVVKMAIFNSIMGAARNHRLDRIMVDDDVMMFKFRLDVDRCR